MSVAAHKLLEWYDVHARVLPWRIPPNSRKKADPYKVWLSEIMLQQTVVKTVKPYFELFTTKWPTVQDLAAAPLDDVLKAWAGLGYYARARNLHACAVYVAGELGGVFPSEEADLLKLPGVGPYTAAAIASIAFNRPANVVDGNIERVMARLHNEHTPLPALKTVVKDLNAPLIPADRAGDYAQALMDLGATICTPKNPACGLCPWRDDCVAQTAGTAEGLPKRAAKKPKPTRTGDAYWLRDARGYILLRRRPEKGLLGGMMEVPSRGWSGDGDLPSIPAAEWQRLGAEVAHTFTHFHLTMAVHVAKVKRRPQVANGVWVSEDDLAGEALPSVMRKVARLALADGW